jgi:hypothetical protein
MKKKNNIKDITYSWRNFVFNNYQFENFTVTSFVNNLNTNKLFIGIMMIFMNLGSRYIEIKLTKTQESLLKRAAREILIFTIAFIGTRDIIISLIITAVFLILSKYVFNEHSKFNLIPDKLKNLESHLDINNDGKISEEEINKAIQILKDVNKKK